MTTWCPVCESPGIPVSTNDQIADDSILSVSRDLPGIEPSHFCSRCPTFFRRRDRFYLTGQHGVAIHGIAVWPHRHRRLVIEIARDGLLVTFHDRASILITKSDTSHIATDLFRRSSKEDIVDWAARRGFRLRVVASGAGIADLVVQRRGPHFILAATKAWFQGNEIRSTEDGIFWLEEAGVSPVLFPPTMVEAG